MPTAGAGRPAWISALARRLLATAVGVVLGCGLAEALVRVLAPQPVTPLVAGFGPPNMVQVDARYGWKLAPDAHWRWQRGTVVRTNSLGFRDHEYGPKAPNEIRILSLGDSFAFGFGVELEQTYGKILERKLRERFPEVAISVINAGVSGYGQHQQILASTDLRSTLEPDIVLASFVAGNDVENNAVFAAQLRDRVKSPVGFLGRHSDAVRLVLKTTYPLTDALRNRSSRNIADTIGLFRQLERDLAATRTRHVMVVIPARHQIRPDSLAWAALLLRMGFDDFLFKQNRMTMDHFARERVPYVDTLPALTARDRVESVVFEDDSHTNALGHDIIAGEILPKITPLVSEVIERREAGGVAASP